MYAPRIELALGVDMQIGFPQTGVLADLRRSERGEFSPLPPVRFTELGLWQFRGRKLAP